MFSPSPMENGPNLPPGYYERLARDNGPEWVARYVHGSHDVFEGQVYPELSDALHCENPFVIPPTWPRIIALDHGLRNPTCVIFAAINQDGVIFLYDEHYEAGKLVAHHAQRIKTRLPGMEKAREVTWVADPSIFSKAMQTEGRVFSVYDEYEEAGLAEWTPGENDIAAGRNRIKTMLRDGKLKFFRGRVPNTWREMTQLHWQRLRTLQDRDAPEQEADVDNHSVDALRYLVMSRPDPAEKPKEAPKPVRHEDVQRRFAKQHIAKAIARHQRTFREREDDFV